MNRYNKNIKCSYSLWLPFIYTENSKNHVAAGVRACVEFVYVLLCSCSLYGALEEAADETQLCLGPHRVWRGGGGEITPHVCVLMHRA